MIEKTKKRKNNYKILPNGKNATGRPPKWNTVEELQKQIDEYFKVKENRWVKGLNKDGEIIDIPKPAPVHITGLCDFLGCDDKTLFDYQHGNVNHLDEEEKKKFFVSITRAKKKCESYAVDQCFEGNKGNKADFILQNNFNWKNRHENLNANIDSTVIETEDEKEAMKEVAKKMFGLQEKK